MDRRNCRWNRISSVVARIFICLVLLNLQELMRLEVDAAGDPAELNCKSIAQYMTTKAINNVKTAKCCNALLWGVSLTTSDVTGCIADKILIDEGQSIDLIDSSCQPKSSERSRRSLALNFNYSTNVEKKWPLPIPYTFNLTYLNASQTEEIIPRVMNYISSETCVRYLMQNTPGRLGFVGGTGCLAYMGRSENPETSIVLENDCYFSYGEILSLMTLSLGLADDSLRPDSSGYIFINNSNLDPSNYPLPFFPPTYITYNLSYDYASVLHAFPLKTTSNRQITYRTNEPLYQNTIGQRSQLSFIDTKLINLIYCSDKCAGVTNNCEKGGYPDPNDCNKCKCPDGWDPNTRCTTVTPDDVGQCGQQFYNMSDLQNGGTIQSPGYNTPGFYDPHLPFNCTWKLTAAEGSHVKITFMDRFGIYCKFLACYDWVEVRYNGSLNDTGPRFCCAAPLARTLKSKDNEMLILFRSFGSADANYAGFQIKFEVDPCTVLWSGPTPNVHSFNGIEAPAPLSKDGCLATCDVTPWCVGVDIDSSMISSTRYPRCFMHTNQTLAAGTSPAQGVDQYRVTDKCSSVATSPPPMTTARTTPPVATLTTATPGMVSPTSSGPTAVSTSAPSAGPSASPMTTTSVIVPTTPSTPGASSTSPLTTIPVIVPTTPSTAVMTPTATSTPTTTSGFESCFQTLTGEQSSGAEMVQSGRSVADCLAFCLSRGCAGVDFVQMTTATNTECWMYTDPQKMLEKYSNPGVTQYINICNATNPVATSSTILPARTSTVTTTTAPPTTTSPTTTTTFTTTSTSTSTTTTTTTTAPQSTFSLRPGVCPTTQTRREGIQSSGATRNSALSTEADCVNFCIETISCIGVDVVLTTDPMECWVYADISLLSNKYSNPGVTQYELTRNCASSTTTAAGGGGGGTCQNTWIIYNNSHSVGATKTSTPMLLADCLTRCATDPQCVAVDFNPASNPVECWVHTNVANINVRYSDPSLTQYVVNTRCPTSPAPPNPGCGGGYANPGEFYPPCSNPVYPPKTCQKQVITFVFQGGCWTQRVDTVNTPCVVPTCYGNSQLATMCGTLQCVVVGWSDWSPCSASCGSFGSQRRYRYAIVNYQYVTVEVDERICNTQVCPCSTRSCSRCCSGYYENNGFCYRGGY